MKFLNAVLSACFFCLACGQFGYYRTGDGQRLVGSSFGLPGGNATFDYVIVGGGTAGLTMANRLAAAQDSSVAVVEAGSFYEISNSNHSQVPAYYALNLSTSVTDLPPPLIDWGFVTVKQPQLDGRQLRYAQGKCFGGSSGRNTMDYHRGTIESYQLWADMVGDQSYTFDNIMPFFKKSVNFSAPDYEKRGSENVARYNASGFENSGGPLHVSYSNYWQPLSAFAERALASLGLKEVLGFNTGELLGYGEFTYTIDPTGATRSSSETSFLQDAAVNTQLQIYPQTLAERILFDADKTAVGVKVSTAGYPYVLSARKEVILSAGAWRSPQMLMLSGIGPTSTLEAFNIAPISALEGVGQGIWDQAYFGITYKVNITTQSSLTYNSSFAAQAGQDYLHNQSGPLLSPGTQILGWEKLPQHLRTTLSPSTIESLSQFPADWPELELLIRGVAGAPLPGSPIPPPPAGINYISTAAVLVAPTSLGNLTLNSTSAADNPVINPNWISSQADREVAVAAFKRIREIAETLREIGIVVGEEVVPGTGVQSDEDILAYIEKVISPIYHASVGNRMGKEGDPNAVVDSQGKVFGVKGLRVVDASAFPILPPGHPQATIYMLAEKIAQGIIDGN